jgi:hypothetical protein
MLLFKISGLAHQMAKCGAFQMKEDLRKIYEKMSRDELMGGNDLLIVKLS